MIKAAPAWQKNTNEWDLNTLALNDLNRDLTDGEKLLYLFAK